MMRLLAIRVQLCFQFLDLSLISIRCPPFIANSWIEKQVQESCCQQKFEMRPEINFFFNPTATKT